MVDPDGMFDKYYAETENGLQYLGDDGKGDANRIAEVSSKDARVVSKSLKGTKTSSSTEQAMKADGRFVTLNTESQSDQNSTISKLKSDSKDGMEHGAMAIIALTHDKNGKLTGADLKFGDEVSGTKKGEIPFTFSSVGDNAKDAQGNIVVGTVHTHNQDQGLSGDPHRMDEEPGKGDYGNVGITGVPWFTTGPKKNHVGTVDKYNGGTNTSVYTGSNILLDALTLDAKQ